MKFAGRGKAAFAVFGMLVLAGCSQSADGLGEGLKSAATPGKNVSGKRAYAYHATEKDRECLARAMFFESNRSSRDGLVAVGSVVMNRLESRRWGDDICGVVGAKRQFAPGVLSRPMNSEALPDVMAAADSVLKGERHPDVKDNVMFFHTAGLKFPYKNMHYTTVAGGNAFYEKRSRLPAGLKLPETDPQPVMVASNEPAQPVAPDTLQTASDTDTSLTALAPTEPAEEQAEFMLAMNTTAIPTPRPGTVLPDQLPGVTGLPDEPASDRFAGTATTVTAEMRPVFDTAGASVAAFDASPEQASAIGAMLLAQRTE